MIPGLIFGGNEPSCLIKLSQQLIQNYRLIDGVEGNLFYLNFQDGSPQFLVRAHQVQIHPVKNKPWKVNFQRQLESIGGAKFTRKSLKPQSLKSQIQQPQIQQPQSQQPQQTEIDKNKV